MHALTVHDVSSSMKNRHYNNFFLILEFTTTMVTLKIIMMMKIIGVITIVKASEDRSHVDDGKWFSDDKIILRTMTVILLKVSRSSIFNVHFLLLTEAQQ